MILGTIEQLKERAKDRPEGYEKDVLSRATVKDGLVHIDEKYLAELLLKYRAIKGAGDLVALVAQPAAKVIDYFFGTDLANCAGCKERQEKLNELMPL